MKLIRILISIIFVIVVGAWSVNLILSKTVRDHTPPVITSESDVLNSYQKVYVTSPTLSSIQVIT